MSRVLVTGSAGTLGTPLVKELRARGHEVTGADLRHWPGERRMDITEWHQVKDAIDIGCYDICYHLAGEFGRMNGDHYHEQLWKANCIGTHNVIRACADRRVRLIFASSSEAYGDLADSFLLSEDVLDECLPRFHNEYALTKFTNEQQIKIAIRNHGLNATILRFFNVYGPGEYYSDYRSVVCLFIYRALKGLPVTVYHNSERSFLYIDDWVQAVARVAEVPTKSGEAFNIASTHKVNMGELWQIVEAEVGGYSGKLTRIEKEVGNVQSKSADVLKAVAAFGLKETVSLVEGIRRTVFWMRSEYGL